MGLGTLRSLIGMPQVPPTWRGKAIVALLAIAAAGVVYGEDVGMRDAEDPPPVTVDEGVVVHSQPDGGGRGEIRYSFVNAGGSLTIASGVPEPPNPIASKLRTGDAVEVSYDRKRASISCPCATLHVPRNAAPLGYVADIVIGWILLMFGWRRIAARHPGWLGLPPLI